MVMGGGALVWPGALRAVPLVDRGGALCEGGTSMASRLVAPTREKAMPQLSLRGQGESDPSRGPDVTQPDATVLRSRPGVRHRA